MSALPALKRAIVDPSPDIASSVALFASALAISDGSPVSHQS
jgi:hypothetical protein